MKMKMLRADIPDLEELKLQAKDDPEVSKAVRRLGREIKYNDRLYTFLDRAYDWQKDAIKRTRENRVVGLIASNQTGKSETAMSLVACAATGIVPDWWEGFDCSKPMKIMVAGVDSNHNKQVLQEKLFGSNNWRLKSERGSGMIPKDYIIEESAVTVRGDDLGNIKIKHVSGGMSEILFRAYSQGREAAQGFQADLIVIDEQPKDDFWSEALVRTATTSGTVVCSFTPLKGMTGLVETLLSLEEEEGSSSDKYGSHFRSSDGWAMVRATWDMITHIPERDKAQMRKGFPEYEVATRTYGMPMVGHGRVIPFDREQMCFSKDAVHIPEGWPHLVSIDIGHGYGRDPSAVTELVWDKDSDIIYVTQALKQETDTTRDLTSMIMRVNHLAPVAYPGDANKSTMNAQSTISAQLRESGVNLLGKAFLNPKDQNGRYSNFKMPGIREICERLKEGRLKIDYSCGCLLEEIDQYAYTENGKLQDKNDHSIDSLRYGVMSIIQDLGAPMKVNRWSEYEDDDFHYNII